MAHKKKRMAVPALLLAFALILAGCGQSAPGTDGSAGAAQSAEQQSAGDAESKVGKRVYGNKKMYIHLVSLDVTEDEGTAVLRFENRTEDETFGYQMDTALIDGKSAACEADTAIDALAGGQTADMQVRFHKPESGDVTLTGCTCIQFHVTVSGYWDKEGTLAFCLKGDNETAKEMEETERNRRTLRLAAEEQDLLVDGDYKITLREVSDSGDSLELAFAHSDSGSRPALKELYIGDTLVSEDQYKIESGMGGFGIYLLDETLIQSMRDTVWTDKSLEISVVLTYRLTPDEEPRQTSRLTFPVRAK